MENRLTCILKRDGTEVPFDGGKIRVAIYKAGASLGIHDDELSARITEEVVKILNRSYAPEFPPMVEAIQDVVEEVLIRRGHAAVAKAYILYRAKRAVVRERCEGKRTTVAEPIPYKALWRAYVWAVDHGVGSIEGLNARIAEGSFPSLVRESDRFYERQVAEAAGEIVENREDVRIVIVAGPSSSGKTTTTIKLGERLEEEGLKLKTLNVDNYFFDLELHPKDEHGDYDFETPEALDLQLINGQLKELIEGKEVRPPFYDFKTGKREGVGEPMSLASDEILIIDCLHGLYDEMTAAVAPQMKYKLYIETLAQMKDVSGRFIRWYDIRLLRRMIRDSLHRSYDPRKTLMHWHYVRRSEIKHIIPFIHDVDFIVNSALPYELPILKNRLFGHFPGFLIEFKDDPDKQDAFIRAQRVSEMLDAVGEVEDDSCVTSDSLLREFIGGSSYEY